MNTFNKRVSVSIFKLSSIGKCFHRSIRTVTAMNAEEQKLYLEDDDFIGYKKHTSSSDKRPGILFCSGLLSSLNGTKAQFLHEYCVERDLSYVRFDYMGHGCSSGTMADFSVGLWKQNTLNVIDKLTQGPQIIVGSSIGGWISLLAGVERKNRMHSLINIASAADFMWKRFAETSLDEQKKSRDQGFFLLQSQYQEDSMKIPMHCIDDAKMNCLLDKDKIDIQCPVRLIHGMNDDVIPYSNSLDVAKKLASNDVQVLLEKNGDHRMSEKKNLDLLAKTLDDLLRL